MLSIYFSSIFILVILRIKQPSRAFFWNEFRVWQELLGAVGRRNCASSGSKKLFGSLLFAVLLSWKSSYEHGFSQTASHSQSQDTKFPMVFLVLNI